MRVKTLLFLSLYFFIASSCKKSNTEIKQIENIDSISETYFIQSKHNIIQTNALFVAKSKFDYHNDKLKKRSGSLLPYFGGYSYTYTDKVYDTIIYNGNIISLYSVNNITRINPYDMGTPLRYILSGNKPTFRVITYFHNNILVTDSTQYFYNSKNELYKTTASYRASNIKNYKECVYTYDINKNLIRIEGVKLSSRDNVVSWFSRTVEEFDEYDNAANPLYAMWLWDDLFYRSLSRNNFAKYTYKMYDNNDILQEFQQQAVQLKYDERGRIIYK